MCLMRALQLIWAALHALVGMVRPMPWHSSAVNAAIAVAAQVIGPKADKDRIPGIDVQLADGDVWKFGNHSSGKRS